MFLNSLESFNLSFQVESRDDGPLENIWRLIKHVMDATMRIKHHRTIMELRLLFILTLGVRLLSIHGSSGFFAW